MKLQNLEELFVDHLEDLYDAESRIVKALPKMAKKASSPDLQAAFNHHLEQTKGHVQRLEQVFAKLGKKTKSKTCAAMKGLLEEGDEVIGEAGKPNVMDAGMIAAAQKVEHYEMAAYGTARTWAKQLGHDDVVGLLEQTLEEEKTTDKKLTDLAQRSVNADAAHA
jgi:ferritin-like metal-binding protein YciE